MKTIYTVIKVCSISAHEFITSRCVLQAEAKKNQKVSLHVNYSVNVIFISAICAHIFNVNSQVYFYKIKKLIRIWKIINGLWNDVDLECR